MWSAIVQALNRGGEGTNLMTGENSAEIEEIACLLFNCYFVHITPELATRLLRLVYIHVQMLLTSSCPYVIFCQQLSH